MLEIKHTTVLGAPRKKSKQDKVFLYKKGDQ